jgi:hypothetical protein
VPDDVVFAQIDRATGLRANSGSDAELEVFARGSEPRAYAARAEPEVLEPDGDVVAPSEAEAAPHPEAAVHDVPSEAVRPIEEEDLSDTD